MIVTLACDTGVAVIFYDLFKPVNKSLSLLAVLFRLIFVAVMAVNSLSYFGAVAMVPFGLHCLLIGSLIFRSGFIPRILGVLMALAGLGHLILLWPHLGIRNPYHPLRMTAEAS